jgi:hypothetical protein
MEVEEMFRDWEYPLQILNSIQDVLKWIGMIKSAEVYTPGVTFSVCAVPDQYSSRGRRGVEASCISSSRVSQKEKPVWNCTMH